ncbi:MAG: cupin domain-containing protein, partial [Alphaproteobacteria bacterium]|nr:cupin domain-containing protein [Alphaproteobacteria bacterium]
AQKRAHRACESVCVYEYEMADPALGGATATIEGRYPQRGFAVNLEVRQLCFVLAGEGEIVFPEGKTSLAKGDMVLIGEGEKFAWNGKMELFLANAPRFDPAQYRLVD